MVKKCSPSCPVSGLVAECEGGGLKVGTCLTGAVITNTTHLILCYTNFASAGEKSGTGNPV